jgi:hypothetical protein
MKRSILFVMVVSMLVMAGGSVAYASTSSDYALWSATAGGNGGYPATPHKGYATTTIKCAVCHAVHKGTDNGELLLGTTVANSCVFCHITQTTLGGNVALYNGVETNYTADNAAAHDAASNATCTACHAVHGASTWGDGAPAALITTVSKKILKSTAGHGHVQPSLLLAAEYGATYTAAGAFTDREKAITAFCTQCHEYFQAAHNGEITPTQYASGTFQSHIMAPSADIAAFDNPAEGVTPYLARVANVDSNTCRKCHDAGDNEESSDVVTSPRTKTASNFPHYTAGAARFLNDDHAAGVGALQADAQKDGACLKCHVWDDSGVKGVGTTY